MSASSSMTRIFWPTVRGYRFRRASSSSTSATSTPATARTLPEVSPFFQRRLRERLQNQASPVCCVRRNASSSIQASISTRPSSASCTMAGRSSGCIAKSDAEGSQLVAQRYESCRLLVQDGREECRLRNVECRGHVRRRSRPTRRDDRERHRIAEPGEQLEVVPVSGAVAIDRRHEKLSRATRLALPRPGQGVARGVTRGGVGTDTIADGVDGNDDGLCPERRRKLLDEL